MTISSETRKAGPTPGNGVAIAFPFAFKVFNAVDVLVQLNTIATGQQQTLVLNDPAGYTVVLNPDQNANPGGTVTYNPGGVPLPATKTLTIGSVVTRTQGTHLINGGSFLADNIENMVDRAIICLQQMAEQLGRSLRFPFVDGALTAELPTAALRASKTLAFDASGNVIVTSAAMGGVPVETLVQVIDTIALLKALAVPAVPVTYIVRGFAAKGDGGGGFYHWDSADVTADNGGTVIQLNVGGAGRFVKLF